MRGPASVRRCRRAAARGNIARLNLDDPKARPRIAGLFLASTLALVVATAALTFRLVDSAVEERVRAELVKIAQLLGAPGFPLNDLALRQVGGFLRADIVAVDAGGRVVAASLAPEQRRAFERACAQGGLPRRPDDAQAVVGDTALGPARFTVGVAPLQAGAVYVLYPEDLLAAQRQRAWLPVTAVAALATVAAALLGRAGERRVVAARTEALLRLLVSVAHEVKNPLGAIRAIARSQARRARDAAADPQPLELIAAESERLSLLVDGLRSVGQPVRTTRRALDPDATTAQVLALLGPQLAHRRVSVDADLQAAAAAGVVVEGDASHLQQVALNLLKNAADAMPRGGAARARSRVEGQGAARRWTLTVEDEGPGVPEAARRRLFEPFHTTKEGGLGVGLYLSRRLARAHGGDLTLDAGAAAGARFVLSLPVVAAPAAAAVEEPTEGAQA